MAAVKETSPLDKLREPFADHLVSKLPKETRAQIDERKTNKNAIVWKCEVCGGTHHKGAIHLDYVGHAALTDRLLDTDILWTWEPLAFGPDGLPALDRTGGLWIKLTVCGVTRLGYGCADGKSGGDAIKEIIGDALRNAAMRFGAALELWHKGTLHAEEEHDPETGEVKPANDRQNGNGHAAKVQAAKDLPFPQGPAKNKTELKTMAREFWREIEGCGDPDELAALLRTRTTLTTQIVKALPVWWEGGTNESGEPFEGLGTVITRKQSELAVEAYNAG